MCVCVCVCVCVATFHKIKYILVVQKKIKLKIYISIFKKWLNKKNKINVNKIKNEKETVNLFLVKKC